MRVLIWGAGAIGGCLGAAFINAGHDVTFVDTDEAHVNALNTRGLRIEGPVMTAQVAATAFTPTTLDGTWETILLCTKAQHTQAAARALKPHLAEDGVVVSAQNGLNELVLMDVLGDTRVMGCFVNFGADYQSPGVIHYGGRGAVVLGEPSGDVSERLHALHDLFLTFDNDAITTSNIWGYLWGKMAYGAILFATALTNASIADALNARAYRPVFTGLAKEVMTVTARTGVKPIGFNGFDPQAFMPDGDAQAQEASFDAMVAFNQKSAKTHSGIWRDLAVRKRPTEVDAFFNPILTLAQQQQLELPLLSELVALIHALEAGRAQGWDVLEELQLLMVNGGAGV